MILILIIYLLIINHIKSDLSNDLFTEIPSVLNELPKLKYV